MNPVMCISKKSHTHVHVRTRTRTHTFGARDFLNNALTHALVNHDMTSLPLLFVTLRMLRTSSIPDPTALALAIAMHRAGVSESGRDACTHE